MKLAYVVLLGNALGMVVAGAEVTVEEMNGVFGVPVWEDESLWDDGDAAAAARLGWPEESRTTRDASFRRYPGREAEVLGTRPFSLAMYGVGGMVDRVSMVFANKGDVAELIAVDPELSEIRARREVERQLRDYGKFIKTDAATIAGRLREVLGESMRDQFGEGREATERVMRWDWRGHAILLASPRDEYVAVRIVPIEVADGVRAERIPKTEMRARLGERVVRRENGDVILPDIPMVDQGPKGYCVPATWERVLRYLNIEADMYALAMAGSTEVGGGTTLAGMTAGVGDIVRSHGRRLDTKAGRLSVRGVAGDIDAGLPILWSLYVDRDLNRNITERSRQRAEVTDWMAYRAMLEPWRRSARQIKTNRENAHLCLIIGYNAETEEIAISDSWGPEFAERWITVEEAEAISAGQFLLVNW